MTTIILAAGLSERFGKNKLLLPYKNNTVIEETVSKVLTISDRTIVVVGHEKEAISSVLSKYDVDIIFNEGYKKGQRTSTIKGIERVNDDDFAVLPGDLPLLSEDDIKGVYSLLDEYSVARSFHEGTPGHPVAYRKENKEKLLKFQGTMKEYLLNFELGVYQGSLGTIYDIDTEEKYLKLISN